MRAVLSGRGHGDLSGRWALYQAQTPYVGDNSAVGRVLAAVDTWYGPHIVDYTISLQTSSEPYGLTIHFDSVTAYVSGAGRSLDKRMYAVAPSLLALIGNLGEVRWTYAAPDGTAVTRTVTLEKWMPPCRTGSRPEPGPQSDQSRW